MIPSEVVFELINKYQIDFFDDLNEDGTINERHYSVLLNPYNYEQYIRVLLFNILIYCGFRIEEISLLTLDDFRPKKMELRVFLEKGKE